MHDNPPLLFMWIMGFLIGATSAFFITFAAMKSSHKHPTSQPSAKVMVVPLDQGTCFLYGEAITCIAKEKQ